MVFQIGDLVRLVGFPNCYGIWRGEDPNHRSFVVIYWLAHDFHSNFVGRDVRHDLYVRGHLEKINVQEG